MSMDPRNRSALIIALYLARHTKKGEAGAYRPLGFDSLAALQRRVSDALSVKPTTLKNMRDEYDPYYDNRRAGWYQSALSPSRREVAERFEELDERQLRAVVLSILSGGNPWNDVGLGGAPDEPGGGFAARARTGRLAEELFRERVSGTDLGRDMMVHDCREDGCGYDFRLVRSEEERFVEVKGVRSVTDGVLFTDREWREAQARGDRYYLVVVNVEVGEMDVVRDPFRTLSPEVSVQMRPVVRWSVPRRQLLGVRALGD